MKKSIILTVVVVLITAFGTAQKTDVPQNVLQSFKVHFPNVQHAKWEKENSHYEAEFKSNKTEQSAVFDASGKLLETEIAIAVTELPKEVFAYIDVNYNSKKIKEAAKITDSKGVVTYEAEIKGQDLIFDSNGVFIETN